MKGASLGYLTKEGFRNVWVNRLMSLASITVLMACLVIIGLGAMLFFGLVGYGLFVRPYYLYLKLPDVQLEYDDEFLYIHSKKEAKIPLADLTYVQITAELPFIFHTSFLREMLIHLCSDEYGRIDLDIDGFGSYKLYFVPYAKDMEGKLLRFFEGVMNNE